MCIQKTLVFCGNHLYIIFDTRRSAEVIFTLAQAYARKNTASNFPSVELMKKLVVARRSLGLFQHHDGITGTAKDFVVNDYGIR